MKKTNSKSQIKTKTQKNIMVPLWVILLFVIGIISAAVYLIFQFKPTFETRRSQTRKIPLAVQRSFPKPPLSQSVRVPVLLYHYIEYVADKGDTMRQALNIEPHIFEEQVKTLKEANYTFMTMGELSEVLDGKKDLPSKPIILTFDDGYRDFATDAFPILKKYHVKATQYVVSGVIGKPNYMYENQIQEIIKSDLIEIGAHTVHHVSLAYKLLPVVQYEVQKSKTDLEKEFNIKVVSFAYPNGSFDETAINVVKESGFQTAVSTVAGIDQSQNNRYFLYRLRPGYKIGEELTDFLEQAKFSPPHSGF